MDADPSPFTSLPAAPLSAPDHNHDDRADGSYSLASPHDDHRTRTDHTSALQFGPRPTVEDRLGPTLEVAKHEQLKYAQIAKNAAKLINAAMFAQVIINALVTGLAASRESRKAQLGVTALGAIATVISGALVRIRGTREPERSTMHSQNLEKFIRELEAFVLDEGHSTDRKWDHTVHMFRTEFDDLQTAAHQSENGQPMAQQKPRVTHGVVEPEPKAGASEKLGDIKLPV